MAMLIKTALVLLSLFMFLSTCQSGVVKNAIVTLVRDQAQQCLYAFNKARSNHAQPLFTYDYTLARGAQEWAISIASRNVLQNDGFKKYGELATYIPSTGPLSCAQAINHLYSQGLNDYSMNPQPTNALYFLLLMATNQVKSLAIGMTWAGQYTFIVVRTRQVLPTQRRISGYYKKLTLADFKMPNSPKRDIIKISINTAVQTWTVWTSRAKCTFACGIKETIMQERFCLRFDANRDCAGARERKVLCDNSKVCATTTTRAPPPKKQNICRDLQPSKCKEYGRQLAAYCTAKSHKGWMETNCKKSCGLCTPEVCEDLQPARCKLYGSQLSTYCISPQHKAWMKANCKKSCRYCKAVIKPTYIKKITPKKQQRTCRDLQPARCKTYAPNLQTYCFGKAYGKWMKTNCKKTCGYCDTQACQDSHDKCKTYSLQGYCVDKTFGDWMKLNCPNSCKVILESCSRVG